MSLQYHPVTYASPYALAKLNKSSHQSAMAETLLAIGYLQLPISFLHCCPPPGILKLNTPAL